MGAELREQILDHLENRPYPGLYPRANLAQAAQLRWEEALIDLRRPLTQGESTGDITTDCALMNGRSISEIIEMENHLRQLQEKVASSVGQEILVKSGSAHMDRNNYGQTIFYPYQIYRLARIEQGQLQVVTDPKLHLLFLAIATSGQAVVRTGLISAIYGNSLNFERDNLSVPQKAGLCFVGTEEISDWRKEEPHEEYYQRLSRCLTKHLSPVPTS